MFGLGGRQKVLTLYTREYVLLRVSGNNNAHAFPLGKRLIQTAPLSATIQLLEEEPRITNYARYVQEVAHSRKDRELARPRSFERRFCCTQRDSQRNPPTAVHMALLMLVYLPFGLGCVCVKRHNRPAVDLGKRIHKVSLNTLPVNCHWN